MRAVVLLLATLHQTTTFFDSPKLPLVRLSRASKNFIFIKTHKTASSTCTSIFHNIATNYNKSVLVGFDSHNAHHDTRYNAYVDETPYRGGNQSMVSVLHYMIMADPFSKCTREVF